MKIRITYREEERAAFERVRGALIQSSTAGRQHTSTAPGGVTVWYMTTQEKPCQKPRQVLK